jgi:hypothetical protein
VKNIFPYISSTVSQNFYLQRSCIFRKLPAIETLRTLSFRSQTPKSTSPSLDVACKDPSYPASHAFHRSVESWYDVVHNLVQVSSSEVIYFRLPFKTGPLKSSANSMH